jgi:hypothetical protein
MSAILHSLQVTSKSPRVVYIYESALTLPPAIFETVTAFDLTMNM